MSRRQVAVTLGLGCLLVGMLKSPKILVMTKYWLDHYAGGFSAAKSLVLILFLVMLAALSPLPSPWKKRWNWSLPIGLFLLHLASAAEQLYYCVSLDLPLNQRSVLVFDGMQSSTRFEHIHASKGMAAVLLRYSGQTFDGGFPFLGVFSEAWLFFHAFVYIAVAGVSFFFVHHYQKELSPERTLFLALAIYLLVKGAIDGGPLSLPEIARVLALAMVFLTGRKRASCLILVAVLLPLSVWVDGANNYFFNAVRFPVALLAACLPLLFEQARLHRKPTWVLGTLLSLALLLAYPWLNYKRYTVQQRPPFAWATFLYGNEPLKAGWTISLVSAKDLSSSHLGEVVEVKKARRLAVTRFTLARDTTPFELCRHYRLNVLRTPVIWYQGPGYVIVEGNFDMPDPAQWLDNELVTAYSFDSRPGYTRLVLELFPGAQTNVAVDLLPKGPFATRRVDLRYQKPEVKAPWIKAGGAL